MDIALAGSLVVLALVDSTSIGTLLVPVWLLLAPGGVRTRRMLLYLGTIAGFYLVVGGAVALGAFAVADPLRELLDRPAVGVGQLALGVGLVALSFRIDPGRSKGQVATQEHAAPVGRVLRWRDRAVAGDGSPRSLVLLALGAGTVEVATMLPYLAAIGMVSSSDLPAGARLPVLAGYCAVMVLPAVVLVLGRRLAGHRLDRPLRRFGDWMTRNAAGATGWVVGIAGFLVARDALARLGGVDAVLEVLGR